MLNKKAQISETENRGFLLTPLCKKAQIGETMTWLVATLIIVFILVSSVYVAVLLGKAKSLQSFDFKESSEDSFVELQTLKAYEINSENKILIGNWINNLEEENEKQKG